MQQWIDHEFHTLDLGDQRLNRRCRLFLQQRMNHPQLSIPASIQATQAASKRAEVEAAYRLLDNDNVTDDAILQPHYHATRQRIAQQAIVIVAQDTTEIDLTRPSEVMEGIGPLGAHDQPRVGAFLHTLLAMSDDGVPLGLLPGHLWTRDPNDPRAKLTAEQRANLRDSTPFEQKESVRWVNGFRAIREVAAEAKNTALVSVSDSESDIYELLLETKRDDAGPRPHWIVRACQNRGLTIEQGKRTETDYLFQAAEQLPQRGERQLNIRSRPKQGGGDRKRQAARSARSATCVLRTGEVTIAAPADMGRETPAVTVNVLLMRESQPPAGEEAIEWLLLTDLPIATTEEIDAVQKYYCLRWSIEVYFKVLKSGCRIEASQLMKLDRFRPYLAVMMVVAWRLQMLTMLGRVDGDLPCTVLLDAEEWQSAYAFIRGKRPPSVPPSLGEMVEIIGLLGGWMGRKSDGPPGCKSMWIGFQRMRDLATGRQISKQFGDPPAKPK